MTDLHERLVKIEEQTKGIKEALTELVTYQRAQNGSVKALETSHAVLTLRVDNLEKATPIEAKPTSIVKTTSIATTAAGILIAVIEYFKR